MARRGVDDRPPLLPSRSFVLDAQGLGLYVARDRRMRAIIAAALEDGFVPVISVLTLAEQRYSMNGPAFDHALSSVTVVDANRAIAERAARLLAEAALDGHENLIDAFVVATGSFAEVGARVASSDASHMPPLCKAARVVTGRTIGLVRI
ncbi:hypothetical protein [Actinomadura rubrisoli]|uniref:Type II toxin-antitoxin system VapC family toxin n=1 Tax=Actinomadura rubrisoli TaxID=2530368 RepID=A0A4R5CFG5_9ACTN|nr:hypothetical protein [Actinomadura rubrisoli]TDD97706.1 hypothetical protein E1298_01330 [Actinomadura rubrisoli]